MDCCSASIVSGAPVVCTRPPMFRAVVEFLEQLYTVWQTTQV